MSFQKYCKEHDKLVDRINYMFDSPEWFYFQGGIIPVVYARKIQAHGKESVGIPLFIDSGEIKPFLKKNRVDTMVVMRPLPALRRLIELCQAGFADGLLVNNEIFIATAELEIALTEYTVNYFNLVESTVDSIADEKMKRYQYLRAFFILPSVFIPCTNGTEENLVLKLPADASGEKLSHVFVFSDREKAGEFIGSLGFADIGVKEYQTTHFISENFDFEYDVIAINQSLVLSKTQFLELEHHFMVVE